MNVVDLFAGIGCWSTGLRRCGFTTVAACELDEWKRRWLAREFPKARLYADVRRLTGASLAADGIVPDIIVGSPPCKEYSAANTKGRGLAGDDLFLHFVRLVAETRPRWACAENSPRIRTKGFDRISREFESAGYTCRAFVLGADDLGAPHIRKRAWIIANREEDGRGSGRPGRSDSGDPRQQGEFGALATEAPDAIERTGAPLASGGFADGSARATRRGPVVDCVLASTDAAGSGRQSRPGPDQPFAEPADDAGDAAREQMGRAGQPRQDDRLCSPSDADGGERDALGQSLASDTRPELGRAIGPGGMLWNGGPGRYLDLVDGHSSRADTRRAQRLLGGEFRRIARAAGDAILPDIAFLIGRSILTVEAGA